MRPPGEPRATGAIFATDAIVALGANLGDRATTLDAAIAALAALPETRVLAVSRWHESVAHTPQGLDPDKPAYLNGVAHLATQRDPHSLLHELRRIEIDHGRDRSSGAERWGDRTLDLDLIVHGTVRLDTPELTLPHPRAHERDFVLRPWLEVQPQAVLDGHGPIVGILAQLESAGTPAEATPPADARAAVTPSGESAP